MNICKICGKEFQGTRYMKPHQLICSSGCFEKNFWIRIIAEKDCHQIVDGECYCIGDENSTSCFRGCAGRSFVLRNLSTRDEVTTTNLWCQGKIPDEFKGDLPDTHEFLRQTCTYERLFW